MTAVTAEVVSAAEVEGYIVLTDEQAREIEYLRAARANETGWKRRKEALTAKIKDALAGAKGGITADGRVLATIKTRNGRRAVDLDKLASVYPEAYAACVSPGAEQVVLDLP